jgi:hypothetical protein
MKIDSMIQYRFYARKKLGGQNARLDRGETRVGP